jgi:hypothetical protein
MLTYCQRQARLVLSLSLLATAVLVVAAMVGCGGQGSKKAAVPDKPIALPDPNARIGTGSGAAPSSTPQSGGGLKKN